MFDVEYYIGYDDVIMIYFYMNKSPVGFYDVSKCKLVIYHNRGNLFHHIRGYLKSVV